MTTKRNGFTLIELLVVIVIIGIASTIIVVKSSHYYLNHRSAERFVQQINAHCQLAQHYAVFSMSLIGMSIQSHDYQFSRLIHENDRYIWQPLHDIDPFWTSQPIPDQLNVQLSQTSTNKFPIKGLSSFSPQIIFYPSGEISPFTMAITSSASKTMYQLSANHAGQLTMSRHE